MRRYIQLFAVAGLLTACATVEDRVDEYRYLSCSELDQKIGKNRYIKRDAQNDQIASAVVKAIGNRKQREEADIDGLSADIGEDTAQTKLEALRILKRQNGCPN